MHNYTLSGTFKATRDDALVAWVKSFLKGWEGDHLDISLLETEVSQVVEVALDYNDDTNQSQALEENVRTMGRLFALEAGQFTWSSSMGDEYNGTFWVGAPEMVAAAQSAEHLDAFIKLLDEVLPADRARLALLLS